MYYYKSFVSANSINSEVTSVFTSEERLSEDVQEYLQKEFVLENIDGCTSEISEEQALAEEYIDTHLDSKIIRSIEKQLRGKS